MLVDMTKLELFDIDGAPLKKNDRPLWQELARYWYVSAKTIDLVAPAMDLYKTGKCDLSQKDIKMVLDLAMSDGFPFATFARKAIIEFFENLTRTNKEE